MRTYFERYGYIAVTLLSSLVTFLKSYLFMDILSKEELGYLALFQSMVLMVNFFQLGVIYGGYRVISFSLNRQRRTNDAVVSYLFLLFGASLAIYLLVSSIITINWFWIAGVFVGLVSLWNNWISNMHIALGRTNRLSILLLVSLVLSFLSFPLIYKYPLPGAITLIGLQPILFVTLSYIFNRDFGFRFGFKNLIFFKLTLRLGFIPFLTGILHYINLQIERWVIGYDLGVKALGDYYLVFVYVGLFSVIPGALGTFNFPKFMKILSNTNDSSFSLIKIFKVYYLELIAYLVIMIFGVGFIMPWLINLILPSHNGSVKYVQIISIGLVLFTLIDPISFIINARLHYKELLFIYLFALTISISCYLFLYLNKMGSLINYSYVSVVFLLSISLGYVIYFIKKGRKSIYIG